MEVLAVHNLTFTYPDCARPALQNVSFSVESGEYVALCGPTGSGKSTLLRMLKRELTPLGERSGRVLLRGRDFDTLPDELCARSVGYVMQRPEQQIVTDKVWHELAFGLENLGTPPEVIRRRVSEIAAYFDMEDWFDKRTDELSGGQKQLLNLAAVLVMDPDVLILDEPTAQLDPIAASDFLETVARLNRETGLTILLAEHRLEEVIPRCSRLMVLESGTLRCFDAPRRVCEQLRSVPQLLPAMPAAVQLFNEFPTAGDCPLDVREGRAWLTAHFKNTAPVPAIPVCAPTGEKALELKELFFRYSRTAPDVLRGADLTVYAGEIFCLLGGNGSGKTTLLSCAAGVRTPYAGQVRVFGKKLSEYKGNSLYSRCLALLPQDVQTVFLRSSVREELAEAGASPDTLPYDLTPLLDIHPYDLSGGEQQLVALARVLASEPRLLLLDEPTKGLDAFARQGITDILRKLKEQGTTIVIVTHDADFAASVADRCGLFFRGETVSTDVPHRFFSENSYYTTAVNRMTRGLYPETVTLSRAAELLRLNGGVQS